MSDLGARPAPPAPVRPAAPAPPPSRDIPIWVLAVAIMVMLALAAVVALVVVRGTPASPKASYPAQWDSRVAPYARIAERQRGLIFKHPVAVRFQDPAAFEKSVRVDESKLDADAKKEIKQFSGLMRAFGLISGDVDLFRAFDDATGSGTLAYYSFDDRRISIRGQKLTPSIGPTLVHELTHALQDQYFDIGARQKALGKREDSTAGSVFDAVIEGDADRAADGYRTTLNARQRRVLAKSEKVDQTDAEKGLAKVPKMVQTLISAPYVLGEGLMQVVAAGGGNGAVDKMFRRPPTHENVLLDPFRVLQHDTAAVKVQTPKLASGEKKFQSGELGVLTWYLMLAQRLPLHQALAAADGWGGDSYVGFDRGGTSCARIEYAGRTSADTSRMYLALRQWVAGAPGMPTTVAMDGTRVRFESCDPGKAVQVRKDHSQEAMTLVASRTYLGFGFLRAKASPTRARCLAGRLIAAYPVAKLNDPAFLSSRDPAVIRQVRRLAATCR